MSDNFIYENEVKALVTCHLSHTYATHLYAHPQTPTEIYFSVNLRGIIVHRIQGDNRCRTFQ